MASVYVVGTCDTKFDEMAYVHDCVRETGQNVLILDVGIFAKQHKLDGRKVVALRDRDTGLFQDVNDRGKAIIDMSRVLEEYLLENVADIAGVIGLGGSGNTSLVTRGMRALPIGIPKVMVSTVASGDTSPFVGASDITMMPSITDVQGLNVISRKILGNAAHAVAGMVANPVAEQKGGKPLLGMTMFGVTTPCVQQICAAVQDEYEPLVFHAVGTGGKALEKLIDSGMVPAVMDMTLTEVCDLMMGGIMSAGEDRLGAVARTGVPCVLSVGALDMVNFGALATVPGKYKDRNLYVHNADITLMRTSPEENTAMGRWIGRKLNACQGEIRLLLPLKGVSAIDCPGMPFYSPESDAALFAALEETIEQTAKRKIVKLDAHINDPEFSAAAVDIFHQITNS